MKLLVVVLRLMTPRSDVARHFAASQAWRP